MYPSVKDNIPEDLPSKLLHRHTEKTLEHQAIYDLKKTQLIAALILKLITYGNQKDEFVFCSMET